MDKLKMHSPDLTQANLARISELFPGCVTESRDTAGQLRLAVDFDQLRQELSDHVVEGPQERYQLDWPGKREALLAANAPIAKTLRPCREESVDFDTTQNLFIEGDNLDALKLLQETYLNQVKLIYIDPPYNTGSDLVYRDDFSQKADEYLQKSQQQDDTGARLVVNTDTNGRFHSDWMSMILPRLRLARNLLKPEGVILVSIDDKEVSNLRRIMNEVFGEANFVACMVWEKGRKNDAKLISVGHEYIVVYARSVAALRERKTLWRDEKPGAREIWDKYVELRRAHSDNDRAIEQELQTWFSELPKTHLSRKWNRYKRVDKHGPWRDDNISWPGGDGPRYDVLHPLTKKPCAVPERGWIYASAEKMQGQIKAGLVEFREDHTEPPFRKTHIRPVPLEADFPEIDAELDEDDGEEEQLATQVRGSYFYKQSQVAVKYLRKLLGAKAFNNPKDHVELSKLIDYTTADDPDCIVVDFFAGSGSTAEAVFEANINDGGKRRVILVQVPEKVDPSVKQQKVAAKYCDDLGRPRTIAEITKERIRRAAGRVQNDHAEKAGIASLDVGFRVLKIDTSNMAEVFYAPDAVKQDHLPGMIDNVREGRTSEDLLFQVLLDWGVDLSLPIRQEQIADKTVFFVNNNALLACFDTGVDEAFVKQLAAYKPLRVVFRDGGYASSSVKINVEQLFKLLSPATDIKTL